MRLKLLSCVAAIVLAGALGAGQAARRTEHVVLVTLDGVRWQEVFNGLDEGLLRSSVPKDRDITKLPVYSRYWAATPAARREKLLPFLWRSLLVRDGSIAGNRARASSVAVTNRHWFSYPGYSEMLMGQAHDDAIKSNDPIRNSFPSVLQFARRRLNVPAAKVATFASWSVFSAIVEDKPGETTVNAGVQPYASPSAELTVMNAAQQEARVPWDGVRHDAFTFHFALDYLKRERPRVLYIAFDETDDWAHDGHYDQVLEAIHLIDGYLNTLWTTVQGDPEYRNKTTLIVTTDHGRGRTTDDWRKHGASVPGAGEIWLAIASPDSAARGEWHDHAPLFQNQIAATIATLLGLDLRQQNPQAGAPLALTP